MNFRKKLLLKTFEVDKSYRSIDALKQLYLSKWDESNDETYFAKIEKMYMDKLAANSEDENANYGLGAIYDHRWMKNKEKEFFDKEEKFFKRCLEINEHNVAYHDLGCINAIAWRENNEDEYFEKAEHYFLIGVKENYLYSKMHLATLYLDKWRRDTTQLEYFEKYIELTESISVVEEYRVSSIMNISEAYEDLLEKNGTSIENFDKAIKHLESIFNEKNYIAELAGKIGYMYHQRHKGDRTEDFDKALDWYFIAYELDNTIVWIVIQMARLFHQKSLMDKDNKEEYDLAKKWYEVATEMDVKGSYTFPPLRLGIMISDEWREDYSNDTLFQKAETLFKRVLEIDENNIEANCELASLYSDKWLLDKSKNVYFDNSVKIYEDLIKKFGDNHIYFNNLGNLYKMKWNSDKKNNIQYLQKAIQTFEKAIETNNEASYPYVNLGEIYFSLWESDKTNSEYRQLSKENFEKAYELGYNKKYISNELATIKFYEYENVSKDLKTFEEANKYFKYSIEEKVDCNTEYLKLAENFFVGVLNKDGNNVEAINNLADIRAMNGLNGSKNKESYSKGESFLKNLWNLKKK